MDLEKELRDLTPRELQVSWTDIFPKLTEETRIGFSKRHASSVSSDPHRTIFTVARELWKPEGYASILQQAGFYEKENSTFNGHCHQCTPELGLVLDTLGFSVTYLECFRIREHFPETGKIGQVPPEEEDNPNMKDEFCRIGRIPYCCLEVIVGSQPFYVTGKHLKPKDDNAEALLTPECYQKVVGVFSHQKNSSKSGIYLEPVFPRQNPDSKDFRKFIVWKKQMPDKPLEYFCTYLRISAA